MTKKICFILTLVVGLTLVLDSCASSKSGKRKCDGKKAVRTPMGNM